MSTILITGANKGIGFALAQLLAADHDVILTARRPAAGQSAADEIGARFFPLDVTSADSIEHLVHDLRGAGITRLDALVNNAGIICDSADTFLTQDMDRTRAIMETNLYGPIALTQALYPLLTQGNTGSHIINISSGLGQFGEVGDGYFAYRLSKAALNMFTASAAATLAGTDTKIVSVCPGWVQTDMGGENANLTPTVAAGHIAGLLTRSDLESGKFYRSGQVISF